MLQLRAPAKLNLYLRVLGRRPDGYHELETLFERIDLADELRFESRPQGLTLTSAETALSCGDDNLVVRAARLLQAACGTGQGASIQLIKRIPIAAGLGGGSSDAATTLLGLNTLWGLGWRRERLLPLAARLGSDVPFFLHETPFAVGRGRGEQCQPCAEGLRLSHVLVVPPERLATREVYAGAQFDLTAPRPSISIGEHALRNGSLSELATGLWNDLQPEAIRRCPVISIITTRLRTVGCSGVSLSGSGPAVFGLCRDRAHAQAVAEQLQAKAPSPWRIEIVHTDPSADQRGPWGVV